LVDLTPKLKSIAINIIELEKDYEAQKTETEALSSTQLTQAEAC